MDETSGGRNATSSTRVVHRFSPHPHDMNRFSALRGAIRSAAPSTVRFSSTATAPAPSVSPRSAPHQADPPDLAPHAHTADLRAPQTKLATATATALTAVSAGTAAWYLSLYGNPFLSEAKAESAADHGLHAPAYPWSHNGPFDTFDHSA